MIVEVLKETLFRRRFIRRLHVAYLIVYGVLLLVPFPEGTTRWGFWIFEWSGCLLPILLTAGIFGDDIASGRMLQLATRPISLGWLYALRVTGVYIQCAVHLAVCYTLVFVVHALAGQPPDDNLGSWFLASLLMSLTWATLSSTLSTFLLREYNTVVIIIGAIVIAMLLMGAATVAELADWPAISDVTMKIARYGIPPVISLFELGMGRYSLAQAIATPLHVVGIVLFYAIIGIVVLDHRELIRKRE